MILLLLSSLAQAAPTHDPAVWTSVNTQAALHPEKDTGLRLWMDLHFRRTDANFTGIVRPAVGWDLAPGLSVFAGYAWVPQYGESTDDQLASEHRAWEQLLASRKVGQVSLGLRPRLEQRVLEGHAEPGHRLRLWGRVGVPIAGDVSLAVTDEVFLGINATDWSPAGFDQNRFFVGPALPVSDFGRIELGYLNTYIARESGDTDLHVMSANLFVNFQ